MRIDVFTLFPQLVDNFCSESLLGRARNEKLVDVRSHDLREHTTDVHHSVDDAPFGGGAGMVLRAEPVFESFEKSGAPRPLLLLSPGGKPFDQAFANKLASLEGFSLLCGRYEVSVGDVVLAGGEVGACLIIEAVTRLLPGVMGNTMSPITESFGASGLLEEPHYTRPAEFRGWQVPEVLRNGNHAQIERWRRAQALHRTLAKRPDLVELRGGITKDEQRLLEEFPPSPYPSNFTI